MTSTQPWPVSPRLASLMASQNGLFTADQAYSVGYTADEIQHLRSSGRLHSVRRGVYAMAESYARLAPAERHRVDTRAALLRLRQPSTLSHETAAIWTKLPLLRPNVKLVHLTRPELRVSRREAGVHHHPGALPAHHVESADGAAVTSSARTAVDIARSTDFARGLAAADSCLRLGTTRSALQAVMEYCASWPGARGASRVVASADRRAANPGESWSRAVLVQAGLEPSTLQLELRDADGLVGYADFAWEDRRTLGEFDGRLKYAVPPGADPDEAARVLWAEKRREDRLRALGFEVVRWSWDDLFQPAGLIARILAAFARAGGRRRTAI